MFDPGVFLVMLAVTSCFPPCFKLIPVLFCFTSRLQLPWLFPWPHRKCLCMEWWVCADARKTCRSCAYSHTRYSRTCTLRLQLRIIIIKFICRFFLFGKLVNNLVCKMTSSSKPKDIQFTLTQFTSDKSSHCLALLLVDQFKGLVDQRIWFFFSLDFL